MYRKTMISLINVIPSNLLSALSQDLELHQILLLFSLFGEFTVDKNIVDDSYECS
jgi:hypothetical protein